MLYQNSTKVLDFFTDTDIVEPKLYAILKFKRGRWVAVQYAARPAGLRGLLHGERYSVTYDLNNRINIKGVIYG